MLNCPHCNRAFKWHNTLQVHIQRDCVKSPHTPTTFSILYSYPTSDRYYRGQRGLRVQAASAAEAIAKIRKGYGDYPPCPDAQIVRSKQLG